MIFRGPAYVEGKVKVSGSKNAFFPIIGGAIGLGAKEITIKNVPNISDVKDMLKILEDMGSQIHFENNEVKIHIKVCNRVLSAEFGKIRGSIVLFSALLSRMGKVDIPLPGGCRIGERPIDQHIKCALSVGLKVENGERIKAEGRIKGGEIKFDIKTVTGTENAIILGISAEGETIIRNPAYEPEVQELIRFLRGYGYEIWWIKDGKKYEKPQTFSEDIYIKGSGRSVESVFYTLPPDRIESATWILFGATLGGKLEVEGVVKEHISPVLEKLQACGGKFKEENGNIIVEGSQVFETEIIAEPFPGFPTDVQPMFCVMLFKAKGVSRIMDKVFPERISYLFELSKLSAKFSIENGVIYVYPSELYGGSEVYATDLRSCAALTIASLQARGETKIHNFDIIYRGYENFTEKLKKIVKLNV